MATISLGEKVRKLRWALVLGAFAGTMVIVQARQSTLRLGFDFSFVAHCDQFASFQLLTRKMTSTEDPVTMNVLTGWVGTFLGALVLPFRLGIANGLALVVAASHHGQFCHGGSLLAHHGFY
jgi:drug/metabolite transporter (DMT)-like permease